jgi:hypothetical protein
MDKSFEENERSMSEEDANKEDPEDNIDHELLLKLMEDWKLTNPKFSQALAQKRPEFDFSNYDADPKITNSTIGNIKLTLERPFMFDDKLGWNWHKSWRLPSIVIELVNLILLLALICT